MRRILKWSLVGVVAALLLIQVVPVERTNPPVEQEVDAPAPVRAILRRSCYDCHSHETVWPWYAHVAPVSWLVARDVRHGRHHVNFSAWNRLDAEERQEAMEEIWEEVSEGEMPLWFYLPLHPDARLSDADRATLRDWTRGANPDAGDRDQD
ncbi:MAG: heme-binding domain-containing protein [Acidobacteriota bacterium]